MNTKLLLSENKTLSRKLTCLVALLIFSLGTLSAQTNVSGGIYSSQTWTTAGSPYIIIGHVVVFQGAPLTINPGVVVKFDSNAILEMRDRINASGTVNDSITFTSNLATPHPGDYSGIWMTYDSGSFKYCNFYYGDTALVGPYVISSYSSYPFKHCTFKYNNIALYFTRGPVDSCNFYYNNDALYQCSGGFFHCIFRGNTWFDFMSLGEAQYCTFGPNQAWQPSSGGYLAYDDFDSLGARVAWFTIKYCSFRHCGVGLNASFESGITNNDISDDSIGLICDGGDTVSCNTICNNSAYNIKYNDALNTHIGNNYFCLPDSAQIQASIYDGYQNISLGLLYFTPFDTVACSNVSTGLQSIVNTEKTIEVYPNPSNGVFTFKANSQKLMANSQIEIYNVLGEKVYSNSYQLKTIDLSKQPSGMYLYRITDESGKLLDTGKLIVNH